MTIRTIARRVFVVVVILELLAMASLAVQGQGARPAGWTEATHGAKGTPNYALLFAMDKVHELRIAIPADQFKKMQADVATVGPPMPPGMEPGGRGGFDPQQMQALMEASAKACEGKAPEAACAAGPATGNCLGMFGGPDADVRPAGDGQDDARRRVVAHDARSDVRAGDRDATTAAPGRTWRCATRATRR